ncbi:MAG: response regulator transcription factor [Burkholderiales bacterium]|nr:response regulator transcription factor [Burkholderiales bacterium]
MNGQDADARQTLRVAVLDDDERSRTETIRLLADLRGIEVVDEFRDAGECMRPDGSAPDVVLVSARLAAAVGTTAIRRLREAWPAAAVLMLIAAEDAAGVTAGMRAGASGYVLQGLGAEFLAETLRRAGNGGVGSVNRHGLHPEAAGAQRPLEGLLSPRQREILRFVAEGWSNKEVARALGVAESTVKVHVQHILRKLNLSRRVQAAVYAAESGLAPRR